MITNKSSGNWVKTARTSTSHRSTGQQKSFILTESCTENTLNDDIKVRLTLLFVLTVFGLLKIQQIIKWKEKNKRTDCKKT
jgi:hypothetical protein